ncbi:hypothetical protein HMI01_10610 [Halolactibacillus miurensis]|uniref:Uncharacterized protein n=1 Tax=Halolactibacillus miurensis TaxID=306541 RepID=A0A1I6SIX8_9BACI|nr:MULTISPECIES: hypothetical protein [Halolactibacillus]GEM04073.1 hypothetical protein HMI01_10610 [Halolactibacillus miurensis]SFS76810.1 hypothetical protein SAMN05421668_10981 [Halolactibacillus miurensis]
MNKTSKYLLTIAICFSLLIPTFNMSVFASASESDNSFTFVDENNNKITLVQESDGTIKQYLNDEITNSSKVDKKNNTLVEVEYDNGKLSNVEESNIEDLITDADPKSELSSYEIGPSTQIASPSNLIVLNASSAFPYSSGYSYVKSYKDLIFGYTTKGYKKSSGSSFTSEKKIHLLRDMTLSTAVSLLISALGGSVTWSIAAGALTATLSSALINGVLTKDIDTKAHYETKWETWLGIVKGWNYYKNSGKKYLRVMIDSPSRETLKYTGPVGYVYSYDTFLRDSIIDYTNR